MSDQDRARRGVEILATVRGTLKALGDPAERREVHLGVGRDVLPIVEWIEAELGGSPSHGWTLEQSWSPADAGRDPESLRWGLARWLHYEPRRVETGGETLTEGVIRHHRWDRALPGLPTGWTWSALPVSDEARVGVGKPYRLTCRLARQYDGEREIPWREIASKEWYRAPSYVRPIMILDADIDHVVVRVLVAVLYDGDAEYLDVLRRVEDELGALTAPQAEIVRRRLEAAGAGDAYWGRRMIRRLGGAR